MMSTTQILKVALAVLSVPSVICLPQAILQQSGWKVVVGNDDGWAEGNIRQLYSDVVATGAKVILSAPLNDQSGTGSSDAPPTVPTSPGEYDSVPAGAPAFGYNASDVHLNYVNSYPVTAIKYGTGNLSSTFFGGKPDWVLSGPNVGSNIGLQVLGSGTVGVAAEAAKEGIPAIAFSGLDGTRKPYTALKPGDSSHIYSQIAIKVWKAAAASKAIPPGYFLNVNMGIPTAACPTAEDYTFVFTKVYSIWFGTPCDNGESSPAESEVQENDCYVTISPMDKNKLSPLPSHQANMYSAMKTTLPMECYTGSVSGPLGGVGGVINAFGNGL